MWTNSNIINRIQSNKNSLSHCQPRRMDLVEKFNFIPLNAYESEQYYTLEFALAGFLKAEITIKIEDHILKILAIPTQSSTEVKNGERTLNLKKLQRNVMLPIDSINDSIKATLEDGILKIKFAKNPELKKVINIL